MGQVTAGMTAFDSADGLMMARIYSRTTGDTRRSLDYNIIVTGVSVFIAFLIGSMGLLSVVAELTQPTAGALAAVGAVDLNFLGITVIAFFALAWAANAAARGQAFPCPRPVDRRTATVRPRPRPLAGARGSERSRLG